MTQQRNPLDVLAGQLAQQREALVAGHADDLPAIVAALQATIAPLAGLRPGTLPAPVRARISELRRQAQVNLELARRRQHEAEQALSALAAAAGSAGALQEAQSSRTYAAAGRLSAPVLGPRVIGRA